MTWVCFIRVEGSSRGERVRGVGARLQRVEVERGHRLVGVGHGIEPLVAPLSECVIGAPVPVLMHAAEVEESLGAVNGPAHAGGLTAVLDHVRAR